MNEDLSEKIVFIDTIRTITKITPNNGLVFFVHREIESLDRKTRFSPRKINFINRINSPKERRIEEF